ncbi:MAG: threonine synthase [Opitutales bacterium]
MKFISTRGKTRPHTFTEAVAAGLAPDGGLFLPDELPDLSGRIAGWKELAYPDLCAEFLGIFADDIERASLNEMVREAYRSFSHPEIAPLRRLDSSLYVLELFHGPTLAFKDFALQLLGNLYREQIRRTGRPINVLGATSGDTGAAAIHGLRGKEGVSTFILYPDGRVSPLQERQMACTGETTVFPLAIQGNFDDAQAALKEVFGNRAFCEEFQVSAINSINLARILAQCVYYLFAWLRLSEDEQARLEFVVPTGNFGNVLAGWILRKMGVPIPSFRIATNQNDILYRLFTTGKYKVDTVQPSLAPSMDIQVASNFERFLYYALKGDSGRLCEIMGEIKAKGEFVFEEFGPDAFSASRVRDEAIPGIIARTHERYGYVVDPHTACALADLDPSRLSVVLATAHPAKFPETIGRVLGSEPKEESLEALKTRPVVKYPLEGDACAIMDFIREHGSKGSTRS